MADGRPQGRPRTTKRRTTIGVPLDVDGWLEFAARDYTTGMAGYLMALVRRDRAERMESNPEEAERYRAYLMATNMLSELESL